MQMAKPQAESSVLPEAESIESIPGRPRGGREQPEAREEAGPRVGHKGRGAGGHRRVKLRSLIQFEAGMCVNKRLAAAEALFPAGLGPERRAQWPWNPDQGSVSEPSTAR